MSCNLHKLTDVAKLAESFGNRKTGSIAEVAMNSRRELEGCGRVERTVNGRLRGLLSNDNAEAEHSVNSRQ